MKHAHYLVLILVGLMFPLSASEAADKITTISIGRKPLVKDCIPLGLNLGGDTYYSGAALVKKRTTRNFEGVSYRQAHFGPVQDARGATTWSSPSPSWQKALVGGRYTILSGPGKGTTGTIAEVSTKKADHKGTLKDFAYFVFDKPIRPGPANSGILVERIMLDQGQFRSLDGYWTSKENRISIGDVPPGSFGQAAAVLNGKNQRAHLRLGTHYQRYGQTNGVWNVHFWAKTLSGDPSLTVKADRNWGESKSVPLTDQWVKHQLQINVDGVPESKDEKDIPHLLFVLEVTGGEMLLDDVELWMEGDQNPTAFRDDCVAALKAYKPGILRYLQMGGNTLDNCLMPPLRAHSFASTRSSEVSPLGRHSKSPYSLHEMYELCEYLGCQPWYCLPGTLTQQEISNFIEYLGGSETTKYGKLRGELGNPQPWTKVFSQIHVEFGNEAWNNAPAYQLGGFNGPDYWSGLIATGKKSPHYHPSIVFHAGGQAANSYLNKRLLKNTPNADRFSVAPYILQSLEKSDMGDLDTDDKLFRWALAWPMHRASHPKGAMRENYEAARSAGIELSVYEINHHITHGDGPLEPRNKIVTSLGGGLNVANTMMQQLKYFGIRSQCLFSISQHSYNAQGVGAVRLWGTVLNMRKGQKRFRPTFLACAIANRVIVGDLIETAHLGANPTFSATGVFAKNQGKETINGLPTIHSYAFRDGKRNGVLLINLDTSESHKIRLRFSSRAVDETARGWLLTADSIAANNEFETEQPQVTIKKATLSGFSPGWQFDLPAHSLLGLTWQSR